MTAVQQEIGSRGRIIAAARQLFVAQGFHQTPMSELATVATVSVGQVYRLFKNKNDIILAIVDDDSHQRFGEMEAICERVKAGDLSIEAAVERITLLSMEEEDEALTFEILAEAHRNPDVAAMIGGLCGRYREIMRDLARVANPKLSEVDLDAAEELLLACLFGLGHRSLSRARLPIPQTAALTARMIVAALREAGAD